MKKFLQKFSAAIVLFLPFYYVRFKIYGLPTNAIELLVVVLFILTLYYCVKKKPVTGAGRLVWPTCLILAGITISSCIAADKSVAFGILKGWFVIPVLYYFCVSNLFDDTNDIIFRALFLNVVIVGLYGLLQWLGVVHLLHYQAIVDGIRAYVDQHRAIAFFESPNYLAMYLVPPVLLVFNYYFFRKEAAKLWLLTVPILAVILTSSRGGIAALVFGLVLIVSARKGIAWAARTAGLTLVILIGLLLVAPHGAGKGGDESRTYIWKQAAVLISEHPLLGIGPGQFNAALNIKLANDSYYQASVRDYALHAHNILLNFWLSGGLISLVGFIWLVVVVGWRLVSIRANPAIRFGLLASLLAILIHGMVDTTYFKNDLAIHFWLIMALSVTIKTDTKPENEENRH